MAVAYLIADKVLSFGVGLLLMLLLLYSVLLGLNVDTHFFAFTALIIVSLVVILVGFCGRKILQTLGMTILAITSCLVTVFSGVFIAYWVPLLPVAFLIVLVPTFICYRRHGKRLTEGASILNELTTLDGFDDEEAGGYDRNGGRRLQLFDFAVLMSATNGFSIENKLGQGGFGPVFKGKLPEGKEIAVKRLLSSDQGLQEFKNELILIASLQHVNLVRLLGFCVKKDEKLLVYEYMRNKSLDFYLFDDTRRRLLDWKKRYTIIEGIAQGLIYLHEYSRLPIIHRDLKPGNILLDASMKPKISDFGLARIFDRNKSEANTLKIVGTRGYISLEYAMGGIFSEKSDVYSFGVLLLEIVSGRKVSEIFNSEGEEYPLNLVGHAWKLWKEGRSTELIDSSLEDQSSTRTQIGRCIHVALLCIQDDAAKRPTISGAILMISNETVPLPDPRKPTTVFTWQKLQEIVNTSSALGKQECYSINEASISELEPR